MTTWVLLAFACYMVGMLLIGVASAKKNKSSDDFFLGGRNLGGWVTAFSAQASDMSGWLLMGLPGCVYAFGTNQAWIAIGLLIGTICNWLFISGRLRTYTIKAGNAMTIPEYLSNRFRDKKRILMTISAVVIVVFFLVYTASAFSAGGKLFASVTSLSYHQALVLGAVVILAYTFIGGFVAVCNTDLVQGLMMFFAVLAIPIIAVMLMGAGNVVPNIMNSIEVSGIDYNVSTFLNIFYENGEPISIISVLSQLAWGLGYCGMPHILVRFMAVKDEKELAKSKKIGIAWVLISLTLACVIGVVGRAYLFPDVLAEKASEYEMVFIEMIKKVFTVDLNLPFVAGLFLCGILAAIMSTADSQLLVSSSAVSNDLFKGVFFKNLSEKATLTVARVSVLVIAVIALFIAWDPDSSIMLLVSDAWAGLGSAFGPAILLSLYWKRTNLAGAATGMITGGLTVIIWDYVKFIEMDGAKVTLATYTGVYSLLVGFFLSLFMIIIVSLATPKVSDEIIKEFEDVKNGNV